MKNINIGNEKGYLCAKIIPFRIAFYQCLW